MKNEEYNWAQEEGLVECPKCKKYCDPELCWRGDGKKSGHEGHSFYPWGCICGFPKKD